MGWHLVGQEVSRSYLMVKRLVGLKSTGGDGRGSG